MMRAIAIATLAAGIGPASLGLRWVAVAASLAVTASVAVGQTQPQSSQQPQSAKAAPTKPAPAKAKPPAKPKADPSAAQGEVDAGVTALGSGRAEAAVNHFNTAITSGTLPSSQSARALYYRGVAHRRTNKPAQAISDLTNALWIKNGLTPEQREDALRQRSAAYRDAGLPEQGEPPGSAGAKAAPTKSATANATPFSGLAPAAPAASSSSGGFFSSLFGGSAASNEPTTASVTRVPPTPMPPTAATASTAAQSSPSIAVASGDPLAPKPPTRVVPITPSASGGSIMGFHDSVATPREVEVNTAARAKPAMEASKDWAVATEVKPATGTAAKGKTSAGGPVGGRIHVLVAAVASADQARGVAQRVQKQYASDLAGRVATVDQTATGAGIVYRVQVGPFASARDTMPLCAKLKSEGLDCRVQTP